MKAWHVCIAVAVVVLIWLGNVVGARWLAGWFTSETGAAGDSFGAVNALFSGLAFAILICTLIQQQTQLTLQREELKLQREEMQQSREELARTARAQAILAEGQLIAAILPIDHQLTITSRGGLWVEVATGKRPPTNPHERRFVHCLVRAGDLVAELCEENMMDSTGDKTSC